MTQHTVSIFKPYPFSVGQKIRIEGNRREGDWEVVDIGEHKVTLRCPISNKEFTWDMFCYFVEEKHNAPWPLTQ
ncbi:MAG: hypothetical protein MRK02_12990 [Candidatus Scalindua sp.]|nr:hypothetical protein [Candidatus Scalindua sp.]